MLSPMMTVFVLATLWLIVVVPMVLRRNDERSRERSVDGFGRAMRALGRRTQIAAGRPEVFVPRERRTVAPATPARRPVPAAQEALMYPVDRSEMSDVRMRMMTRRRRSLGVLIVGSLLFGILALARGGTMWLLAAPFLLGVIGYVYFLRSQALKDRERRANRQQRAGTRAPTGYDATEEHARFESMPDTAVRIDDDDIELHNLDTVDLTGFYNEQLAESTTQRRAS
jgi:hypothetical protein